MRLVYKNRLRGAVVIALILSATYLVGRFWFDEPAEHDAASQRAPAIAIPHDVKSALPSQQTNDRGSSAAIPAREAPRSPELPSTRDDRLIEMWTEQRDAMRSLYDIIYQVLLHRGGPLAACRKLANKDRCNVRLHCAVHGDEVEIRVDQVYCGLRPGEHPADSALQACVHRTLSGGSRISLPAQTATELAGYDGPFELAWYE